MFTLYVRDTFAAAHRIEEYHGKCEELHGHNFKVEALFEGEDMGEGGMLLDFAVLKSRLQGDTRRPRPQVHQRDPFLQREGELVRIPRALHLRSSGRAAPAMKDVAVQEVRVWESENAYAAYGG